MFICKIRLTMWLLKADIYFIKSLNEKEFISVLFKILLKDESHQKAEVLLKKLRMQYQRSATENVLITHKLNTTEHLKLVGKPANLIVLLYEHSSIDQRIQNPTGKDYPG